MKLSRTIYYAIMIVLTAFAAGALSSCGTSKGVASTKTINYQGGKASQPGWQPGPRQRIEVSKGEPAATRQLLTEANSWIGTSYRWGGEDRSGVDCSGLVTTVFNNALGIKLPRTSREQQQYCSPVDRGQLKKGDLVFFTVNGGSETGHVGIYVGNGNMIHSSSSKGVIISSIEQQYYVRNYAGAGRVDRYYAMTQSVPSKPQPAQPHIAAAKTITLEQFAALKKAAQPQPQQIADAGEESSLESPEDFFE